MRMVLTLAVALLIASPVLAAPKKGEKKAVCPAAQAVDQMTRGLTLTDDQKAKLDSIKKEFGPKLTEAMKALDVLTPEQKQAGKDAAKAAKAAGKKARISSKQWTMPSRSLPSRRPRSPRPRNN